MKSIYMTLLGMVLSFVSFSQSTTTSSEEAGLAYEYTAIEEKPLFGGETAPEKSIEALESYVAEKAQSMGFSHGNSCYVSFVISSTGKVINAQIVRGKSSEFNQAALEIITELPDWTPGSANGANVNVAYTIDVVL